MAACGSSTKLVQSLRTANDSGAPSALAVHALLHDGPVVLVGDDEAVQIKLEAILNGGAVNFRHQPARAGERGAVNPTRSPTASQFTRRPPRMLAAAAADMNAEFAAERVESPLQRSDARWW